MVSFGLALSEKKCETNETIAFDGIIQSKSICHDGKVVKLLVFNVDQRDDFHLCPYVI